MGGEDWKAEARRLLDAAQGANDNSGGKAGTNFHFHGPVTLNFHGDCSAANQRRILQDRLNGFLLAEGDNTTAAFQEELSRLYRKTDVDQFSNQELADLVANFTKLIRLARVLGTTPKR